METIIGSISLSNTQEIKRASAISRFLNWCEGQEKNHFGWLAGILAVHGCVLTPITLFAVILSGTNLVFFITALVAMGMSLVTNLAAMPTKVTIPTFLASVIIDLVIIIACASVGFNITSTYI